MKQNDELLTRRVEKILPSREGLEKLISERKIRLYLGIDPTGFQLHIGHGVVLKKIQEFIDAGHEVIFLVGSFTGKIGDPSDRESERVQLTNEQIEKNMADYRSQAGKLVDFSRARFVYNGDWLNKLTFEDVVNLAARFTVQQMIERDMFQKRLKANKPIHLHEFLYPLMQGYDSVHLEVDLEIGGNDQLFNMMAGRTLLKAYKNKEKFVLTTPLLVGTNGQKMSKSVGNCVWLTDTATDMFGKLMSIPDEQIIPYMELVTDIPLSRIKVVKQDLSSNKVKLHGSTTVASPPTGLAGAEPRTESHSSMGLHPWLSGAWVNPMDAKKELAGEVVKQFHGASQAKKAKADFEKTVQQGETPEKMPTYKFSGSTAFLDILELSGSVSSKGEAKRLIQQKGINVDGKTVEYKNGILSVFLKQGSIIQVGKRKWLKLV